LYANVDSAKEQEERDQLERRYQNAANNADIRGARQSLEGFETAVEKSKAVIARPLWELLRLASSESQIYATYYQLLEGGVRSPAGDKWDVFRPALDAVVFPSYCKHIRYAALSLDGRGSTHYGDCFLIPRDDMIAHRASVLEENALIWASRYTDLGSLDKSPELPKGYRATWNGRARLAVAKLGSEILAGTLPNEHARILLKQGTKSEDDEFIEVHIFGPLTIRTLEEVLVHRQPSTDALVQVRISVMRAKLLQFGVNMKVI